jgi:hypothetical protein
MQVKVAQLYEDGGRPLPRHRAVTTEPGYSGVLSLTEEYDRDLRRSVRSAHLRDAGSGADVLPPLRDAVVIWFAGNRMTLTGFETDALTRCSVAQSWYIEFGCSQEVPNQEG